MDKHIDDRTLDGRKVNMIVTQPSQNRWLEKQKNVNTGKETTIIRDFFPDRMMVNLSVGAIKSFSTFVRRIQND